MPNLRAPAIRLPDAWPASVKSGVLYVICLARYALAYTRSWAANSINERVRLKAENQRLRDEVGRLRDEVGRLRDEVGLLREEIRIKDARVARIAPQRRPYYPPTERMAILELRAARGWSLAQTARAFLVTAATVASWMKRVDEDGPDALVQIREPVNKFPEFIAYIVRRLKTLCPAMGKRKIAETLARAGLHLGATTVGRMLKDHAPRPVAELKPETRGDPPSVRGCVPDLACSNNNRSAPPGDGAPAVGSRRCKRAG